MTTHDELTVFDSGWPEQQQRNTMAALRDNGWSTEGIARVFHMTSASVEHWLRMGKCGVCELPHLKCSRQDWRRLRL